MDEGFWGRWEFIRLSMTDQHLLEEFIAPSWAGDWCPRCDWAQTCADCRVGWGSF